MRVLFGGIGFGSIGVLVLSASLFGQTPVPVSTTKDATPPAVVPPSSSIIVPQKPVTPADVPADAAIVTIQGLCEGAPAKAATAGKTAAKAGTQAKAPTPSKNCKTVVTKGQMESMMDLLLPGASQDLRHQFVVNYIRMLAASGVALDKRLDHDPAVAKELQARLQFTRMQVLAGSLYRRVEKVADNIPEAEVEKYYADHAAMFTQGEIERLSLPKSATPGTPQDVEALKTMAEEMQARAAKGEDFDQLQKEITHTLSPTGSVPSAKAGMVRRSALPPMEAVVFDLKPGEVTKVLEGSSGFEILKLVSVQPTPLESVRAEIKTGMTNYRLQEVMKDATKDITADFNLAYLNLPTPPDLFLAPSLNQVDPRRSGAAAGRPGAPMMPQRPMPPR